MSIPSWIPTVGVPYVGGSVHSDHATKQGYLMAPSGGWQSHHFVAVASTTNTVDFDLCFVEAAQSSTNPSPTQRIRFDHTTGTWSDVGSSSPAKFSTSASSGFNTTLTVTSNVDIHMESNSVGYIGYFTMSGWTPSSSGAQGGQGGNQPAQPSVDPIIQSVGYTKTDDDSVTLTFDWDENNGPFNQYKLFRLRPNTILYNNSIGVSGTSGSESRTETTAPLLGGLEDGDKLYIENSQAPLHIVSGFGSIVLPYTHKLIDFSIGYVLGSKVVIAKFFGSSPTPLPNTSPTFDGRFVDNEGDSVDWSYSGNLLSINLPYKLGCVYQVKIRQVGSSTDVEDYGPSYRVPIGKVFCNFW